MKQKDRQMLSDRALGLWVLLLIALLFVTGILDQESVITNLQKSMNFEDGNGQYELSAGDAYGRKNDGPFLNLPAGEYRLKWQIEGDGENILHLGTGNGVIIEPAQLKTIPGEWQGEGRFILKDDAHNFNIYVEFASGTWMKVYDFRLYTPEYRDHTFTATFLILALYILFVMWRRGCFTEECLRDWIVVAVALLVVSSPFMQSMHLRHHDTVFHGARILNLADALRAGQIPGRVGGFSYNGYGAVTSVFYPDLLLYPAAFLVMGGASLAYAMNVTGMIFNALSAATAALCALRMFGKETASLAAVLYLCAPYRMTNMLFRGAVGEAAAMAVLPVFILGLWEVIFADHRRWRVLGIGAALMMMTHILSTAICGMIAVAAGVLFLPKIIREKRMLPIMKATAMAALLGAFFLVPMLTYSAQGIGAQAIQGISANSALEPFRLFTDMEIGIVLLIGAAAAVMALGKAAEKKQALVLCLIVGVVSTWMTTTAFPWSYAAVLTGRLTDYIQFPFRFESIMVLMLSLAGGYGLVAVSAERRNEMILMILGIALLGVTPMIRAEVNTGGFGPGEIVSPYTVNLEYQIPGTDVANTRSKEVIVDGDARLTAYEKDGTRITAQVETGSGASLSFPLFGFDGYAAELNGERIAWRLGHNNRLTVDLPAGASGEIRIWFEGKAIWRIADAVSLAAALGFAVFARRKRTTA